jgi:hypothetical protein
VRIYSCPLSKALVPQILTASWRAVPPEFAIPVGISRSTPRRMRGYRRVRALEPGPWFRSVGPVQYLELYQKILDRLDPTEICKRLLSYGACPVMMCWESASDCHAGNTWCHRHLVAQWLEDRLGIEVREIDYPTLDPFAFLRRAGLPKPDYRISPRPNGIASDNVASRKQK